VSFFGAFDAPSSGVDFPDLPTRAARRLRRRGGKVVIGQPYLHTCPLVTTWLSSRRGTPSPADFPFRPRSGPFSRTPVAADLCGGLFPG